MSYHPARMTPVPDSQSTLDDTQHVPTSTEHVLQAFKDVWEEYSTWSIENGKNTLDSLSYPSFLRKRDEAEHSTRHSRLQPDESKAVEDCSILDYDRANSELRSYAMQTITIDPHINLPPYPPYTSCAPTSQNILVGDDSHYLPFVPFSDDPTYDFKNDLEIYHYVEWQRPIITPDEQVISLEALKRLLSNHKLSKLTIDNTEVLPMDTASTIALVEKRDFPTYPGLSLTPKVDLHTYGGPKRITKYFLDYFCTNASCVIGFCTMHDQASVEAQVPKPNQVPSRRKPIEVANSPCGDDCFLRPLGDTKPQDTVWSTEDEELFSLAYGYEPDVLACDLAVICRKSCHEVWQLQQSQPSALVTRHTGKSKHIVQSRNKFDDVLPSIFTPNDPCRHSGPCNTTNCECYRNRSHCHTRCGCIKTCSRRWKGCTCGNLGIARLCRTKKCPCFRAHIECDPGVCTSCESRSLSSNLCCNVGIQKGTFKSTEVRESRYGSGLFMCEPCEEGELITEYVGEMIYEPTVISRNLHAKHQQRSYVFGVNPTVSLDGSHVGNESRYINHSESPNCSTKVLRVNGSHRIGIYAARSLQEGDELFINYGPGFWESNTNNTSQSVPNVSILNPTHSDLNDCDLQTTQN